MIKKLAELQRQLDYYRTSVQTDLKSYQEQLFQIKNYHFEAVSTVDLLKASLILKRQASAGVPLETLIPEGYALVREAVQRILGLCPFDSNYWLGWRCIRER